MFLQSFRTLPPRHDHPSLSVDQWRTNKLKTGCSTQTINRDVATLKAAISKAVEWDVIESNPLSKLKLFKVDTSSKIRYLEPHEENRLRLSLHEREKRLILNRDSANEWRRERSYDLKPSLSTELFADYLLPMFLISINTGIRQGELFSLHWENIDFTKKILTVAGSFSKNGKTRHVPLNKEAFNTLTKWYQCSQSSGLVFPSKNTKRFNNIHKSWQNTLKQAQIENFRWHDLRHHFASRLVMAGVDLNTVRELLGHSDIKMTLRYAHLAPEHKAAAVAKLDNYIPPD